MTKKKNPFRKTVLDNGIRVVTEHHPFVHSVSIGVWIEAGTRDEDASEVGLSHFLEHLVFKGTKKRTAYEIARSLEEVGGELNAYTTREYTVYHATTLKRDWRLALDILSDITGNMKISKTDFERERSVVVEEILMSEDDPEDLAYDMFLELQLPGHPLGRRILGTEKTLKSMGLKSVLDYYKKQYCGTNIIISAAGNLDHNEFVADVEKFFGKRPRGEAAKDFRFGGAQVSFGGKTSAVNAAEPVPTEFLRSVKKPTEQLHLLMGLPCPSFTDPLRFSSFLINAWLGGGMTSKLYQQVREKRGLVYSIYSVLNSFTDYGMMNIGASAHPAKMPDVLEECFKMLIQLQKKGMSSEEIKFYKRQIEGSLLLGAEDVENRMNSLAINEMVFADYRPVEEVIAQIQAVTAKEVRQTLERWSDDELGILLVGANSTDVGEWLQGQRKKKMRL